MKNTVKGLILVVMLFVVMPGICGNIETHYNKPGVVVGVEGAEVSVCDNTMNVWVFNGEGYHVGDNVTMKMFNNYTDNNIYDDEIVKVKKN